MITEVEVNEQYQDLDEDIKLRVKRGAVFLDEKRGPHWAEQVALEELDMNSCLSCVLGQLFGDYRAGADQLKLKRFPFIEGVCEGTTEEFGFQASTAADQHPRGEYYDLSIAWHREILDRRGE